MAARRPIVQDTTPQATPAGTPNGGFSGQQHGHDFTLQAVMEMQKSIGSIESSINNLADKIGDQSQAMSDLKKKVGSIEKVMYAAGVVLLISLTLAGWMINAGKDFAMTYFKASVNAQLKQIPPPPTPVAIPTGRSR